MRRFQLSVFLFALVVTFSASPAQATIETIKGTLTCFLGCARTVVQKVAQGDSTSFEVVGRFVDLSTAVQFAPNDTACREGVCASYGARRGGANSSIVVNVTVAANAAQGERTIRMRYAVETNGPDTFRIRVVRRGTVTSFEPENGLPLNQPVILTVRGTRLTDVEVPRAGEFYRNASFLPGGTATRRELSIEFTENGKAMLPVFDSALNQAEMETARSFEFAYAPPEPPTVSAGTGIVSRTRQIIPPPLRACVRRDASDPPCP